MGMLGGGLGFLAAPSAAKKTWIGNRNFIVVDCSMSMLTNGV
jgi:hypothetical protein